MEMLIHVCTICLIAGVIPIYLVYPGSPCAKVIENEKKLENDHNTIVGTGMVLCMHVCNR